MTLPAAAWDFIGEGLPPSAELVQAALGEADAAVLGELGAAAGRDALAARVLGLGPLERCAADGRVTDVLVNGGAETWVDRGEGLVRVEAGPVDEVSARALAVRLAALAGRRLDDASPFVDGVLPGGVRLHAVLPPLSDRVLLSLRVPRRTAPRLTDLVAGGSMPARLAELLRSLVRSRSSFVVTGGTGSGKTTLLAALLAEVPHDERIVVVEDVRELRVAHPHVVSVQTRAPNVEGAGEIGLVTLVRQSLRMRPDRLVVGEVRGAEVRELLIALNTGHEGGCGSLHANSAEDVVARFVALGVLAGLTPEAVCLQLAGAVDVVVHLCRDGAARRVTEVAVVTGGRAGRVAADAGLPGRADIPVAVVPALASRPGGELCEGPGWPALRRLVAWPGVRL